MSHESSPWRDYFAGGPAFCYSGREKWEEEALPDDFIEGNFVFQLKRKFHDGEVPRQAIEVFHVDVSPSFGTIFKEVSP
jgi:hypothetical protein